METITKIISAFHSVSLEELEKVKLLDRQDTKFIFNIGKLPELLRILQPRFHALEIKQKRIFDYDTRYFDTADLSLYLQHHNGLRPRFKIRYRHYDEPEATYFEIKTKNNRDRTRKKRIIVESMNELLHTKETEMVKEQLALSPDDLRPSLDVNFSRMTLVNLDETDRITIDIGLGVSNGGEWTHFDKLVIAEIKQPRYRPSSQFFQAVHGLGIYEMGLSKYCIGIMHTNKNIKYNRFKPKLRRLKKIMSETSIMEDINA